jgi:hypothetical protein
MMTDVPWGRKPSSTIPIPPFRASEERGQFIRALLTWIAVLRGENRPGLDAYALSEWLQFEANENRWSKAVPSKLVDVALVRLGIWTFFPAPWTPHILAMAINEAFPRSQMKVDSRSGNINWGNDPSCQAHRSHDGVWTVDRSERGTTTQYAKPASDDDMILLLEYHQQVSASYPYGNAIDLA